MLSQIRRLSVVSTFLGAAFLSGCADHAHGVMMPVLSDAVPDTSHVEMLVATTRAPDASPAILFSGQRGEGVAFADIEVSLPPDRGRKIGEVQWPQALPGNPATDFVTRKTELIDRTTALAWVDREAKGSAKRQVLVFVHGFNNKFEDAVYRFAQIVHDSGSGAVPVLFTWPSKGDVLAYGYDHDSTNYSRTQLETLLRSLAADSQVGEISILAHSMGNWLALEALRQMAIRDGRVNGKIHNVLLASPDVDVDVARTQIADMGPNRPQFSLFVSRDDKALGLSKDLWGGSTRLGAIDPSVEPYRSQLAAERITVFDLTAVQTPVDSVSGALGHNKFATSPQVVQLIGNRLASGQAITDSRENLGDQFQGATGAFTSFGSGLIGRLGGG